MCSELRYDASQLPSGAWLSLGDAMQLALAGALGNSRGLSVPAPGSLLALDSASDFDEIVYRLEQTMNAAAKDGSLRFEGVRKGFWEDEVDAYDSDPIPIENRYFNGSLTRGFDFETSAIHLSSFHGDQDECLERYTAPLQRSSDRMQFCEWRSVTVRREDWISFLEHGLEAAVCGMSENTEEQNQVQANALEKANDSGSSTPIPERPRLPSSVSERIADAIVAIWGHGHLPPRSAVKNDVLYDINIALGNAPPPAGVEWGNRTTINAVLDTLEAADWTPKGAATKITETSRNFPTTPVPERAQSA